MIKLTVSSIKQKAVLTFVGFTCLISLCYFGLALTAAFIVEDMLIYRLLEIEKSRIQHHYRSTAEIIQPSLSFITLYQFEEQLPEAFTAGRVNVSDQEIFTDDEQHFHFSVVELDEMRTLYMVAEVSPLLVVTNQPAVFILFMVGFVFSSLLGIFFAIKLAANTVQPIMRLAEAVDNKETFSDDKPLPSFDYEPGYLSRTLQSAFDRLDQAFSREKNFTADVSHELRTPLSILKNAVLLIEKRGFQQQDLSQLQLVSQQMNNTVDVLLMLARNESLPQQAVSLNICLQQSALLCSAAESEHFQLDMDIDETVKVMANPQLLELLFINLINNAIAHADGHYLRITQTQGQLIFANNHQEHVAKNIFQPGVKRENSQGIGHGLFLVSRILEQLGWPLNIEVSDAEFVIVLQPKLIQL